ncbi:energy transducer TonB [Pseudomonas sp. N040]|uniref:energy transducer TonB n=1 Tax=Pseudomonas sp. N040 TaxID=2785325 RepID=UPI0018A2DCAF|nr:energy transducer TonB [Pseudomonas sp. N040]MBF7730425.1 energy transducer TonB [Pseudomonas sp. N040]MBW7014068.1 energy transducer TonB [Pseudomonas sp. N040]
MPTPTKNHEVAGQSAPAEVFSRQPAFRLPPQQPRYPAQARRRNQQGVVLLEVRLDERGAQRDIQLLRSSGFPSLDSAALEAVAGWRFHPETINGKGVPSRVQIPIEFALLASR